MDRTLRDQIKRTALRRIVAEIHFEVMIAGDALELPATETADGLSVERADEACHILTGVVHRLRDIVRSCYRGDTEFCRRDYKTFIDKNLRARGMVDRH